MSDSALDQYIWSNMPSALDESDRERLRRRVIADIVERIQILIAHPDDSYALGHLFGRIEAFTFAHILSGDEWQGYQERMQGHGLQSRYEKS